MQNMSIPGGEVKSHRHGVASTAPLEVKSQTPLSLPPRGEVKKLLG